MLPFLSRPPRNPACFGDLYGPPEGADKGEERCVGRLVCVDLLLCLLPCALEHDADAHARALRLHVELFECALECPAVLDGHQCGAPVCGREAQLPSQHPSPEVLTLLARQEASHACVRRGLHSDVPAQEELVPLEVACLAARGHLHCPAQRPQAHPVQVLTQPLHRPLLALCKAPLQRLRLVGHCALWSGRWWRVCCDCHCSLCSYFLWPLGEPGAGRARRTCLSCRGRQRLVAMLSVRCVSAGTSMKVTIALSPMA